MEPPAQLAQINNSMQIALIAAQLIGANVMRGENLTGYMHQAQGVPLGIVKDDKLIPAIKIAKRLLELASE